jgi:hypothetical protein
MPEQLSLFDEPTSFKSSEYETMECSKCKRELPKTLDFFWHKLVTDYNVYWSNCCRDCNKEQSRIARDLAVKYKHLNKGCCDICGSTEAKLVPDHNHETFQFRGWLCQKCNRGLGLLGDSRTSIQTAYEYLKQSERNNFT